MDRVRNHFYQAEHLYLWISIQVAEPKASPRSEQRYKFGSGGRGILGLQRFSEVEMEKAGTVSIEKETKKRLTDFWV